MTSPFIQATINAADVVHNLVHVVLYDPKDYQGLAVKNPYSLQEIIHIIAFLKQSFCKSSTGKLLTATPYIAKTKSYYCHPYWYKSLWRFASNILYKLDLILFQVNDVF